MAQHHSMHSIWRGPKVATKNPGVSRIERAEAAKRAANSELCREVGWGFSPACAEVTGAWGSSARKLLRGLVRRQAMVLGLPVAEAAAACWRRMNAALMKGTALMLVRAYPETLGLDKPAEVPGVPDAPIRIRVRAANLPF